MYEQQPYNPYRNNIAIVKEYFKSPIVLALAIAHILSVIISVVQSIISEDYIKDFLRQLSVYIDRNLVLQNANNDMGNEVLKGIRDALASDSIFTFSIPVFAVLTIVGLMLIYFVSRNDNPDKAPSAGVTMLYVIAVIALVGYIILFVGMMIVAVALFIVYAAFRSDPSQAFTMRLEGYRIQVNDTMILVLAIGFTITAIISGIVVLLYVGSRKRFIGSVKKSMSSIELCNSGAKMFGVLSVILAVSTVIGLISSIANLFMSGYTQEALGKVGINITPIPIGVSVLSIIGQAIAVVIAVLQAKIALGYAKYIDEKRSGFFTPQDNNGGFAPINAGVGTNAQPNPYSYLAQPPTEQPVKDDSFVNPYINRQ